MSLDPGQRIDIKKRIAKTLGQQDWVDVDLTLEEFGFPTSDRWDGQGAQQGYVLDMLRHGSTDEALVQLDGYLHPTDAPTAPPQATVFEDTASPWSGQGFRLFISHVHTYAEHAGALREELAKRSVDAFVAHDSIAPTEEWLEVILYALASCDACLALLTPGFHESNWTDQEVGYCIARNRLVVPVDFGLTPYGFLGRYQALPARKGGTHADSALAIFELLVRKPETRDAMARALVTRWSQTHSFDAARENYGFLRKIPADAWDQQLVNDVWHARDRNHELHAASIGWEPSGRALEALFADLPFERPPPPTPVEDDDIPL
jgi:hypothetical protein